MTEADFFRARVTPEVFFCVPAANGWRESAEADAAAGLIRARPAKTSTASTAQQLRKQRGAEGREVFLVPVSFIGFVSLFAFPGIQPYDPPFVGVAEDISEVVKIYPYSIFCFVVRIPLDAELPASLTQHVVMYELMHTLCSPGKPVVDRRYGINDFPEDPGLFMHFTHGGLFGGLPLLNMPFRQAPLKMPGA